MSEEEERPRFVTGITGGRGVNGLIKLLVEPSCGLVKRWHDSLPGGKTALKQWTIYALIAVENTE